MPLRFHSERKSVNTQSSKSRDQAYTGLAPILLTRYKKFLMPTPTPQTHLESLTHFNLPCPYHSFPLFHPNWCPTQAISQTDSSPLPSRFSQTRHANFNSKPRQPVNLNSTFRQPTQRCSTRSYRLRLTSLIPPLLFLYQLYSFPVFLSVKYSLYSYNDTVSI